MTADAAVAAAAALLSTALISLAPNLILFLFPNYTGGSRGSAVLSIGQALAAGGLLGDVFLHTLPHSLADGPPSEDGHGHGRGEEVGMLALYGFTTFLVFDAAVRSLGVPHCRHHHHEEHDRKAKKAASLDVAATNGDVGAKATPEKGPMFTSTVLLNLVADSLHNFTDGLAIGASFAASEVPPASSSLGLVPAALLLIRSRGGLAAMSIMFHEIPHELGDFSILVSSGFSKRQAIVAQFSTAVAAFLGTVVGLSAMHIEGALGHDVLLPFTAGGFVYLAAVSILPELLEEPVGWRLRAAQILAFGAGVAFMQAVAALEHHGGEIYGHSHLHEHTQYHHGVDHHDEHHQHRHHHHEL